MKYDSIIFDLDGTLWDSTETSARVWTKIVSKYDDITDEITAGKLRMLFGRPLPEIGIALFQSVSRERALKLIKECCEKQCTFIAKEGGILYEHMEETLQRLSKRYELYIVSNCEDGYIESFFKAHGLGKYFKDYECPGRTKEYKAENIRMVIERNQLKSPIYVGDTMGDAMAAKKAGIPFIYAEYGFGNLAVKDRQMYIHSLDKFSGLEQYMQTKFV